MTTRSAPLAIAVILIAALAGACSSDSSSTGTAPTGEWGSSQGSLTVADTGSTLLIANGNCYGAFASIKGTIPTGHFALSGTFTQLTGAFPGTIDYAAQFAGTASGTDLSVTITLTSQGQQLGPFAVAYGVHKALSACLYP